MKTYDVHVTREGRWWMIHIPELDGLTQARRLDEVESMAREYIGVTLDLPLSKVAVSVSAIEVEGQDLLGSKSLVAALREQARGVEEAAAALTRALARVLTDASVPMRDVSHVLGISHQRVSQIVSTSTQTEAVDLARAILKAQQKGGADLAIHVGPGHAPQVVQVSGQPVKKAKGSKGAPSKVADARNRATPS